MQNDPTSEPSADPFQIGLEQFQKAALDAIGAAHTMLDVVESVVRDPAAVEAFVNTIGAFARTASEAAAQRRSGGGDSADTPSGPATAPKRRSTGDGEGNGFERIAVD